MADLTMLYAHAPALLAAGERVLSTDEMTGIQALERIVKLYEGWGKPEKAAEWRKKLPVAPNAKDPSPAKK